jgi:hypothetical protein
MSVEADFGISDFVFQSPGSQVTWTLAWEGVIEDGRFVAVSFQSDFRLAKLTRVSESFATTTSDLEPRVIEVVRNDGASGSAFRFAVVVIPSH